MFGIAEIFKCRYSAMEFFSHRSAVSFIGSGMVFWGILLLEIVLPFRILFLLLSNAATRPWSFQLSFCTTHGFLGVLQLARSSVHSLSRASVSEIARGSKSIDSDGRQLVLDFCSPVQMPGHILCMLPSLHAQLLEARKWVILS